MKMIFLVDGDNNIGTGLKGIEMLSEQDTVLVFYQKEGLALSKIPSTPCGPGMPTPSRRWTCGPPLRTASTCPLF